MAMVIKNLETSLPVPSVKEIAIEKPEIVPSRYVRDELNTLSSVDQSVRVPLIDMGKLFSSDTHESELQKLHSACKDWGAFQLINHGISKQLLDNMGKQSREFFYLPIEEKKRWGNKPGCLEGFGQAFVASEEQKLDWNDMMFLKVFPQHLRRLEFWPDNPERFRETLESYSEEIKKVAISLTKFMAEGLEMELKETEELCEAYKEGLYHVRMNYYPTCPQPEQVIGISAHQDISGITFLLDCGTKPGLQVFKDGQWVPVQQTPGALAIDLGNATQVLTNGTYHASYHRAVVNNSCERHSVVTFCYPNCNVGPIKQLLDKSGSEAIFKTVTVEQYFETYLNRKFGDSFIDLLKL